MKFISFAVGCEIFCIEIAKGEQEQIHTVVTRICFDTK
jgi:hypothetical protein